MMISLSLKLHPHHRLQVCVIWRIEQFIKLIYSAQRESALLAGSGEACKLPVPDSPGLRPTTHRVRETLFNWLVLAASVDAQCLDCFAGSGALGLEALSRYAGSGPR